MRNYQQELFEYIRTSIYESDKAELDPECFPAEYRELAAGIKQLCEWNTETQQFISKLANGELMAVPPPIDNRLASGAKAVQSTMLHLHWLIEQVAKGNYNQQVNFLGEFSEAFNVMINQLRERTESLGYVDTLTHCRNRRFCMELLHKLYNGSELFALAFVDIDYLKYCNDNFGHKAGDRYIQHVAEALESIQGEKIVCRMGGDEFVVVMYDCNEQQAWEKLSNIRKGMLARSIGDAQEKSESFSYGVVDSTYKKELMLNEMMDLADKKMYDYKMHAKKISRGAYQLQAAELEKFLQNMPMGVLHMRLGINEHGYDLSKCVVVKFNKQLADMFGYNSDELTELYQKNKFACVYEPDADDYCQEMERFMKEGLLKNFVYPRLRFCRKDGSVGTAQINIALSDSDDTVVDVYFIYTEIRSDE